MPFTPLHMGPALAIKTVMRQHLSIMVFGWSQIVIDIQPLIVMITGKGHLHGFSHTMIGATLIGVFCGLTGKHLGEVGLRILRESEYLPITWRVSFISAFIGTYSHVAIDSIMHLDLAPFAPFSQNSPLYHLISIETLHILCLLTAIIGGIICYVIKHLHRANHG